MVHCIKIAARRTRRRRLRRTMQQIISLREQHDPQKYLNLEISIAHAIPQWQGQGEQYNTHLQQLLEICVECPHLPQLERQLPLALQRLHPTCSPIPATNGLLPQLWKDEQCSVKSSLSPFLSLQMDLCVVLIGILLRYIMFTPLWEVGAVSPPRKGTCSIVEVKCTFMSWGRWSFLSLNLYPVDRIFWDTRAHLQCCC